MAKNWFGSDPADDKPDKEVSDYQNPQKETKPKDDDEPKDDDKK